MDDLNGPALGSYKKRFQMPKTSSPPAHVPAAASIQQTPAWQPLPVDARRRLEKARCFLAFDVETNAFKREYRGGNKGTVGPLGFYSLCSDQDVRSRIVKLGWAYCANGVCSENDMLIKERFVFPRGFQIAPESADFHGITHEVAVQYGSPIDNVLAEFMNDVQHAVHTHDGLLICHHMEFFAGIVANELLACGMTGLHTQWVGIAKSGLCLMDPALGRWLLGCSGEDPGPLTAKPCLSFTGLMKRLPALLSHADRQHRDVGEDSLLLLKAGKRLLTAIAPPCKRGVQAHVPIRRFPDGIRDNNEFEVQCQLCGSTL